MRARLALLMSGFIPSFALGSLIAFAGCIIDSNGNSQPIPQYPVNRIVRRVVLTFEGTP